MSLGKTLNPTRAAWMLLLATGFWGVSFPLMKILGLCQARLIPSANSWFLASLSIFARFGLAAILLLIWARRDLRTITRLELWQGVGLGFFGGLGILFQMDGVQHTSASTSAFLTQCYCVFIPLWIALLHRKWPSWIVTCSSLMVMVGVAVLSEFDWVNLRLGRGEMESLAGSVLFTGQILWLERPRFWSNRSLPSTLIQFAMIALVVLPVLCLNASCPRDCLAAYSTPATISVIIFLTLACTMVSYGLMNRWQPHISATQAGLIYSSEPLFTSLCALFIPGLVSSLSGIKYANEKVTIATVIGGGLITLANVLILRGPARSDGKEVAAPAPALVLER